MALKGKTVLCSDLTNSRQHAHGYHEQYQNPKPIEYQDIDATSIPYENHFDIITFKSILGGIGVNDHKDRQVLAIREMHKALKPGGRLLFAENAVASALHRLARRTFIEWGDSWRYVSIPEMKSFLEVFQTYDLRMTGILGLFGRTERQRRVLASIDQAVDHLAPSHWKYILYGIAQK